MILAALLERVRATLDRYRDEFDHDRWWQWMQKGDERLLTRAGRFIRTLAGRRTRMDDDSSYARGWREGRADLQRNRTRAEEMDLNEAARLLVRVAFALISEDVTFSRAAEAARVKFVDLRKAVALLDEAGCFDDFKEARS